MTDENQKLRDRIASLENQLGDAKMGNARRGALRAAGCREDWLDDMLEIFDPTLAEDGTYSFQGTSKSTLQRLAEKFIETRPHLRPPEQREPVAQSNPTGRTYADGSPVPVADMSIAELADLAGAPPKRETPKRKVMRAKPGEIANMTLDELYDSAG